MYSLQIRIIDGLYNESRTICILESRGHQFATEWANEYDKNGLLISPTKEQIKEAWKENRRAFFPYSPI